MSAIASFFIIDISKLGELLQHTELIVKKTWFSKKVTDNYWDFLANNATELKSLDGAGFIYAHPFVFLQEQKNMDLTRNEFDNIAKELTDKRTSAHLIFTYKQKTAFINQLDASNYTLAEIQKFNQDFTEDGDEETGRLTLEALQIFHENLNKLQNDRQVLLQIVG
jgi:hypothetical protein